MSVTGLTDECHYTRYGLPDTQTHLRAGVAGTLSIDPSSQEVLKKTQKTKPKKIGVILIYLDDTCLWYLDN